LKVGYANYSRLRQRIVSESPRLPGNEDRTNNTLFWLLERVFAASRKRAARNDCCDACVRGTEAWVLGLIQRANRGGSGG